MKRFLQISTSFKGKRSCVVDTEQSLNRREGARGNGLNSYARASYLHFVIIKTIGSSSENAQIYIDENRLPMFQ